MKENTISQWLVYKGAALLLFIIFSYAIYDVIYGGSLREIQSLINHGDIIHLYRQSIACVSGIPICIYFVFFSLRVLFQKGITPSRKQSYIGLAWGIFSIVAVFFGVVGTFLIPIGLMFSPYNHCPQERLSAYYVTDIELCKTMVPKSWSTQDKNSNK